MSSISFEYYIIPLLTFGVILLLVQKNEAIKLIHKTTFHITLQITTFKLRKVMFHLQQFAVLLLIVLFLLYTYLPTAVSNIYMLLEQIAVILIISTFTLIIVNAYVTSKSDPSYLINFRKSRRAKRN